MLFGELFGKRHIGGVGLRLPAVILVQLVVQALQIVEAPDVIDGEVCLPHKHVLRRQLCQLQDSTNVRFMCT